MHEHMLPIRNGSGALDGKQKSIYDQLMRVMETEIEQSRIFIIWCVNFIISYEYYYHYNLIETCFISLNLCNIRIKICYCWNIKITFFSLLRIIMTNRLLLTSHSTSNGTELS